MTDLYLYLSSSTTIASTVAVNNDNTCFTPSLLSDFGSMNPLYVSDSTISPLQSPLPQSIIAATTVTSITGHQEITELQTTTTEISSSQETINETRSSLSLNVNTLYSLPKSEIIYFILNDRKIVKESIDNSDDRLHIKLQQWKLRNIEKLIHGVNYPTKENIQSLLNISSVFYFEGQNKNQDLLTDHEFSELKSHMMSKFEFIEITEEIKQFVADNKRKFKMDSIDEIQQIIIKEHEYVLWDSTSNLEKSPEPMYIINQIGPIFNRSQFNQNPQRKDKSVQYLEDVMRIHQLLMSTKENAISYLEDSYTTPPHQVYSEWLCPTAGTPFKNPNLRITQEVAQI
nr:13000_t:CDS:2 [Entrophospora candida]